jgi:hypothetical protein
MTHERGNGASTDGAPAETAPEHEGLVDTARGLWRDDRVEVVAAILLALATVLSAWGAYQATRWGGEQADQYAQSSALRADAGRHAATASRQLQLDVASFIAWSQAKASKNTALADFLSARFRAEFVPAFQAWLTGAPADAQGVPSGTPFDQPTYALAEQTKSDQLTAQADAALAEAQRANQISDDFVLTAVLFASVLFFAGTAPKFRPPMLRWGMIAMAVLIFGVGLVVEFSLPQSISI